jgi:hypothetical protein
LSEELDKGTSRRREDLMERKVMKNLLCIGVVLVLATVVATEAGAVTCSTSKTLTTQTCCSWRTTTSGVKYCSLWCTGSEICVNTIFGLGGSIMNDCIPGETCPVTSCEAFGTVDTDTSTGTCDTSLDEPFSLNPTCGIMGMAYCQNHGGNSKLKNPKIEGQPFVVEGVEGTDIPLTAVDCDKQGKCTTQGKLEADLSAVICQNHNWTPLTFTASEFKGRSCFCPGGYDSTGTCCEDNSRTGLGTCTAVYGDGTPTCLVQLCTIDLSNYNPLTSFDLAYECGEAVACGGVTGAPCPTVSF